MESEKLTSMIRLQEEILSRRSLIFTNDQIYFRCGQRIWSEDTSFDDDPSIPGQEDSASATHSMHQSRRFLVQTSSQGIVDVLSYLYDIIGAYSRRSITEEADTISAITGALMPLARQLGGGLLQGLPIGAWDIVISFQNSSEYFGGVWNGWVRKPDFPSWSWAGWKGRPVWERTSPDWSAEPAPQTPAAFQSADDFLTTMTLIVWFKHQHGSTVLLAEASETSIRAAETRKTEPSAVNARAKKCFPKLRTSRITPSNHYLIKPYPLLIFFSVSVNLELAPWRSKNSEQEYGLKLIGSVERFGYSVRPSELILWDCKGQACGKITPDTDDHNFSTDNVELVILSEVSDYLYPHPFQRKKENTSPRHDFAALANQPWRSSKARPDYQICEAYWVMLLEWKEDVYERRGHGAIVKAAVDSSFPPGPVWKEIVLG